MLRHTLLAISIMVAISACSEGRPSTPAEASGMELLRKLEPLLSSGHLDYEVARHLLHMPLHTTKFEAISSGNEIISRSGEYGVKRGDASPPGLTNISFDMAWEKEKGRPSTQSWHREKGLRSSLRLGLDEKEICITRSLLNDEYGSGQQGSMTDSDAITISYGDLDELLVSFEFDQSRCSNSVDIIANDPGAGWPTPSDLSASDAEFVTTVLPIEKSGKQLAPLGMDCGLEDAKGSPEWVCGCDREKQRPTGPCHHAVEFTDLPGGELEIEVWPLLNEEAN